MISLVTKLAHPVSTLTIILKNKHIIGVKWHKLQFNTLILIGTYCASHSLILALYHTPRNLHAAKNLTNFVHHAILIILSTKVIRKLPYRGIFCGVKNSQIGQ